MLVVLKKCTSLSGRTALLRSQLPTGPHLKMTTVITSRVETPPGWRCTATHGMDMLVCNDSKGQPNEYPIVSMAASFLAIRDDGSSSWGAGIPQSLGDRLRDRALSLPKVNLVCLGQDEETYFVQFEDGTAQFKIPNKRLWGFLMGSGTIASIAIGPNNSYYCRNSTGMSIYENLPKGLSDTLVGTPVMNVNLGAGGEWFVRFSDGSWSCGGHTIFCGECIEKIKERGGKIHEIIFGQDETWMIRHSFYPK